MSTAARTHPPFPPDQGARHGINLSALTPLGRLLHGGSARHAGVNYHRAMLLLLLLLLPAQTQPKAAAAAAAAATTATATAAAATAAATASDTAEVLGSTDAEAVSEFFARRGP